MATHQRHAEFGSTSSTVTCRLQPYIIYVSHHDMAFIIFIYVTTHFTDMCILHFFLASERRSTFDVRRRPGYKNWRLFKFSSILLSFKTRHWLFILIYINFGKFKLDKAPNFVTRPASNVDLRTPFGSQKKMRSAHISEMRSNHRR